MRHIDNNGEEKDIIDTMLRYAKVARATKKRRSDARIITLKRRLEEKAMDRMRMEAEAEANSEIPNNSNDIGSSSSSSSSNSESNYVATKSLKRPDKKRK